MPTTRLLPTQLKWTGLCLFSLFVFAAACQGQEPVDLEIKFRHGTQARITCDFSHSGSVIVDNDEQNTTTSLPLHVNAKMRFFQRSTGDEQTIRFFENASGKIKLQKGTTNPSLGESNRLIVARLKSNPGELVELASMTGVLAQSELELIQSQADPMTLPAVFNKSDVKEGDTWKPSDSALAKMLRVHEVEESNVKLLLKKADAKLARVYIMGSLTAFVDDVSTQMDISGIATIDQKSKSLSSLKLSVQETRAPGQIAPGFEGKTKIDIRIVDGSSPQLSSAALAKITKNRKIRQRIKWQSETGNFVVNYEPRWRMIAAEQEAAILRFIDRDELLAQCNIVQLPSRPANKPLTLEAYNTEVAKIVATDKIAKLVSSASIATKAGHSALRIVVAGEEDGLPVNWFYYHVSSQDGRQVTFVFTMAKTVANRVASHATQLVHEFEFQPLPKKVAAGKAVKANATNSKAATQNR